MTIDANAPFRVVALEIVAVRNVENVVTVAAMCTDSTLNDARILRLVIN